MAESQRDFVRRLLRERGSTGVGAHELTYQHGITRAAAIVHTLRTEEGLNILTSQEPGHQAVYRLLPRTRALGVVIAAREAEGTEGPSQLERAAEAAGMPTEEYARAAAGEPVRELPAIGWDELGEKFRRERESG